MTHATRLLMAALVMALALFGARQAAADDEKKVTLDELPAPVKEALQKAAAGGEIIEIEAEEEDGKMEYEAEIKKDGKVTEIELDASGKILAEEADDDDDESKDDDDEQVVALDDLPAAVKDAVQKAAAGGEILEITAEEEDGAMEYEAEIKKDGKVTEIEFDATGKVLEEEADDDDDEGKDDDDEQVVALDDLPAAVKDAVQKAAAGGEILEITAEKEDGKMEYEAEIKKDGKVTEIELDATGKVLEEEADDDDDDEGEDDEEELIAFADAPAAVQKAIQAHFGDAKIEKLEAEKERGAMVYEAEVNGKSIEVSADGETLEIEKKVEADALPAAVKAALGKKFPGATVSEAEAIQVFVYEVKIKSGDKTKEVKVSPSGKISSDDDDDDDDDDDEDDDDDDD